MIVNFNEILKKAKENKYAVGHFNINNLEWTRYILEECESLGVPVILGVSSGAARYMGGYNIISSMVKAMIHDLNITIPVVLHVDHGSLEECIAAIDAGFSSVMIDASREELDKNILITKEVVDYAHKRGVSVEAELGHIGGSEDNIVSDIYFAKLDECIKFCKETGCDALAPALGSVHGPYKGEPNLQFDKMKEINDALPVPLVLHGGSGVPEYQVKKAIECGITKININTDLQMVWAKAVRKFLDSNSEVYDPRKIIGSGEDAVKERIKELVFIFGTQKMQ